MSAPESIVSRDDAGRVTARVPIVNGRPHGLAESYAADGRRIRTAPFRAGALDGELVEETDDGHLMRFTYKAGVLEGPAAVERAGRPVVAMTFKGGQLEGPMQTFDAASGRLLYEATYTAGLLDGRATVYGDDGTKQRASDYRAGLLDGEVVEYGPNGEVKARTRYRAGKQVTPGEKPAAATGGDNEAPWYRRWAQTEGPRR